MRRRILVRGAVQGMGFRPFVYREANELGLAGWVMNSPEGVTIEAEGDDARIESLLGRIHDLPPLHASIAAIETVAVAAVGETGFAIRDSTNAGIGAAQILPDLGTCTDCLRELFDPADRRYLYPFITCTHCGPRYSIIEDVPYDRARTSMRGFTMCAACRAEYEDPADRRFHAETNACLACGPRLALWDTGGATLARNHGALVAAANAVRDGRIVAVKGIGGFHLIVDARDENAVQRLRERKHREAKPFAVMFPSLEEIRITCIVEMVEKALVTGPARPILLLRRHGGGLAPAVAPGNPWLGAILPYAPVHHLLMRELDFPIVATSGNISDEPIVIDENKALTRLAGIADLFLVHDRPIVRPLDDSVIRIVGCREMMLRRARGFAPAPVAVDGMMPGIVALGGHLKATIAITQQNKIILSPHLGDLGTVAAEANYRHALDETIRVQPSKPAIVARDAHPDYASRRLGADIGAPAIDVPHHLAHVVACMAENGIAPPMLGVAWDGTGYGGDDTLWGGEFLLVEQNGWRRVAHLRPFRLPGGEAAAREPRRAALGLLYEAFGDTAFDMTDLPPVASFAAAERAILRRMLSRGVNAPYTSSAGRMFDGFAAICGLCQRAGYEGQAACQFEWAAEASGALASLEFNHRVGNAGDPTMILDWQPALAATLESFRRGGDVSGVAVAFHRGLAAAIADIAIRIGQPRVALSGGCFQNAFLLEATIAALRATKLEPIWHRLVPPNDGGLALGQAVWASWQHEAGAAPCA